MERMLRSNSWQIGEKFEGVNTDKLAPDADDISLSTSSVRRLLLLSGIGSSSLRFLVHNAPGDVFANLLGWIRTVFPEYSTVHDPYNLE